MWFFLIILPLTKETVIAWRQFVFKKSIKWKFMEIHMPREVPKSPRAMEQIFLALSTLGNYPDNLQEVYVDGEVTRWFSMEMVSFGGEVHFYVRCRDKLAPLVKAAFYAYYQDVEVEEVPDYIERFPTNTQEMNAQGYDMWGTEMLLKNSPAFPIKSYKDFEAPEEEKQFDPMSAFLEILGNLKKEEIVGIQILIAPMMASDWSENKLYKKKLEEIKSKLNDVDAKKKLAELEKEEKEEKKMEILRTMSKSFMRSPGENDRIEAIERNLSKPAFRTTIRFIYLAPKAVYSDDFARRGLVGAFNQYGSLELNSFKASGFLSTRTQIWQKPHILPKKRLGFRKERLLHLYRTRDVAEETSMGKLIASHLFNWAPFKMERFPMNVESLATIFHPPTTMVLTAPHIKRIESRRAGPPAGLPIFGDEKELEKFK